MAEPRQYRIQIRTEAPINLPDLDEFHALAGRLAKAIGRDPLDVSLAQHGSDLVAEITTLYLPLTATAPTS